MKRINTPAQDKDRKQKSFPSDYIPIFNTFSYNLGYFMISCYRQYNVFLRLSFCFICTTARQDYKGYNIRQVQHCIYSTQNSTTKDCYNLIQPSTHFPTVSSSLRYRVDSSVYINLAFYNITFFIPLIALIKIAKWILLYLQHQIHSFSPRYFLQKRQQEIIFLLQIPQVMSLLLFVHLRQILIELDCRILLHTKHLGGCIGSYICMCGFTHWLAVLKGREQCVSICWHQLSMQFIEDCQIYPSFCISFRLNIIEVYQYHILMAEILNHNPEDNPRLSQIYQILLLAGYFRIRISSLKAFDKVIGGIAWCITSSNFEIEVEYNDEMQIGQKIKVSEHICNALINMKCPYSLQPFQLQGLDVNNIFPVVQWLVKFVYETRFQRQKYNREISVLLGKDILKLQNKGNAHKIPMIKPQRTRINRQIMQIKQDHPIRVYSALLQYNDATSLKMYHKLHNIITNKLEKDKEKMKKKTGKKDGKQESDDFMAYLQTEEENQTQGDLNNFGEMGKFSLEKLEKIIQENKEKLEDAIREHSEEINEQTPRPELVGLSPSQQLEEAAKSKQLSQDKQLRNLKLKNDKYQAQIKALKNQLQNLTGLQKQIEEEKKVLFEKKELIQQTLNEVKGTYTQIDEIGTQIQTQLANIKSNNKIQKLAEKKMTLKQKKNELKKKAKAKLEQLQQQKTLVQASVPEIDEEAFKNMLQQAQLKKEIYDKKYEQLTLVNQQLAILQRKAENYTSPAQIAQYHQRFIELFEAINCLIEDKRSMFNEVTSLQGIKKLINNYQQFLSNAKDGVANSRKKNDKKQLADGLKQILDGFESNMRNAKTTLEKLKSTRQSSYSAYMDLVKFEREYLKVLRNFKVQYENVEKLYR